jgi:hypothetical protein
LTPVLIPLSSRSGPTFTADGIIKDSYLLCIKAVVPSSVSIPGRPLNWLPFQLYRAQSESVAQIPASTTARPGTAISTASDSTPLDGKSRGSSSAGHDRFDEDLPFPLSHASPFSSSAFPPSASGSIRPFTSSAHTRYRSAQSTETSSHSTLPRRGIDRDFSLDDPHLANSSPSRPSTSATTSEVILPFSSDWVVALVKDTVAGQEHQGWRSWDVPARPSPRNRTASNPTHAR